MRNLLILSKLWICIVAPTPAADHAGNDNLITGDTGDSNDPLPDPRPSESSRGPATSGAAGATSYAASALPAATTSYSGLPGGTLRQQPKRSVAPPHALPSKREPPTVDDFEMAKALIEQHVTPRLLHLIPEDCDAATAWYILADTFASQQESRVLNLRTQLITTTYNPKLGVTAFYNSFMLAADALDAAGGGMSMQDLRAQLIHQLYVGAPHFRPLLEQLISEQATTLANVLGRLQATEQRLKAVSPLTGKPPAGQALTADTTTPDDAMPVKCAYCHHKGHSIKECRTKAAADAKRKGGKGGKNKDKKREPCEYCGKSNHATAECFKRLDAEQRKASPAGAMKALALVALALTAPCAAYSAPTGYDAWETPSLDTDQQDGHQPANRTPPGSPRGTFLQGIAQIYAAEFPKAVFSGGDPPANAFTATGAAHIPDIDKRAYDHSDFMLEDTFFHDLEREFGPFDFDGAADTDGSNSHLDAFYSTEDSFLNANVAGKTMWLNPPFRHAAKFLRHYLDNKMLDPENTSAVILVPHDPSASWWPLLDTMTQVRHWDAGVQLFTLPSSNKSEPRRRLRPCGFPVSVFYDAPVTSAAFLTAGSTPILPAAPDAVPHTLIVDSGASHHMTHLREFLHGFEPVSADMPSIVFGAGGQTLPVAGMGTLIVTACGSDQCTQLALAKVLYVPDLTVNLVSLSAVTARGGTASFNNNSCYIHHPDAEGPVLRATLQNDTEFPSLYTIAGASLLLPAGATAFSSNASSESADLWHQRLGHLGYDAILKLKSMSTGIAVPDITIKEQSKKLSSCGPCMAGRQTRNPRPAKTDYTDIPLFRVYADLCGPFPSESLAGSKYFFLLVDEATRYSQLLPIESKSQAAEVLLHFIKRWQTFTGRTVRHLRTDKGTEFLTKAVKEFLDSQGTLHELTPGYSPESNAIVERANRVILEKTTSMLSAAHLPDTFWAEASYHANFLRNVSPTAFYKHATPWELFHGSPPDLSGLKIFGSLAHVYVPKELRRKLEPKSFPGVVLSFSPLSKMYRVFYNDTVYEHRDVQVDESKMGWLSLNPPAREVSELPGPEPYSSSPARSPNDQDFFSAPDTRLHVFFPDLPSIDARPATTEDPASPSSSTPGNIFGAPSPPHASAESPSHLYSDLQDLNVLDEETSSSSPEPAASQHNYSLRPRDPDANFGKFFPAVAFPATSSAAHLEPTTVAEARASQHWNEWKAAMDEEYQALLYNCTWELDDTPTGRTPLPCKWVFKLKLQPDGTIERYKARLVAGGHRQRDGIDYGDVFAPVSRFATVRALLAVAAHRDWPVHSLDISNAFLNGVLESPVYMKQPEGYSNGSVHQSCKLLKTLYGLKQAPKEWFAHLTKTLQDLSFIQSSADSAFWYKPATSTTAAAYLAVWVDDIIFTTDTYDGIAFIKSGILSKYKGRDLGAVHHHLNIYIERNGTAKTIKISQPRLTDNILNKYDMVNAKPRDIPMSPGADLSKRADDEEPLSADTPFAECVGALLYLSSTTRPDLACSVSHLAKHMSNPAARHWTYAKSVLAYLATTRTWGITFGTTDDHIQAYTDSDYATCKDSRKSRTGFVFTLFGGAVTWCSKMQSVVALSTAESEYIAASHAAREGIWLRRLAADFGIISDGPMALHADNQASISMATSSSDTARTKHIDVAYHFLRQCVLRLAIRMVFCPTANNAADMFTKPLGFAKFQLFTKMIGVS